jgi:hypothetical protein
MWMSFTPVYPYSNPKRMKFDPKCLDIAVKYWFKLELNFEYRKLTLISSYLKKQ